MKPCDIKKIDDFKFLQKVNIKTTTLLDKLQALNDGYILIPTHMDCILYNENNVIKQRVISIVGCGYMEVDYNQLAASKVTVYSIKESQEWYEKIPDTGILCLVKECSNDDYKKLTLITDYVETDVYRFKDAEYDSFMEAIPVKIEEIEPFIYKGEL